MRRGIARDVRHRKGSPIRTRLGNEEGRACTPQIGNESMSIRAARHLGGRRIFGVPGQAAGTHDCRSRAMTPQEPTCLFVGHRGIEQRIRRIEGDDESDNAIRRLLQFVEPFSLSRLAWENHSCLETGVPSGFVRAHQLQVEEPLNRSSKYRSVPHTRHPVDPMAGFRVHFGGTAQGGC